MPQVVPFVSGFIKGFGSFFGYTGGSTAVGAGASSVGAAQAGVAAGAYTANAALLTAVSMGVQKVAMDGMESEGSPSSLSNVIDPMPSSRTIYGETRTGGVMVFAKATRGYTSSINTTKKNQILHLVIELAGHPCDSIQQIYLGNTALNPVQVSASNPVAQGEVFPQREAGTDDNGVTRYTSSGTSYDGQIGMKIYKGSQLVADDDLIQATSYQGDSDTWTTSHVGLDKTYVYIRLHFKSTLFRGIPQFTFDVRGKDTISFPGGAAGYTTNPIKCLYDYMTMPRERGGFGVETSAIDNATWQAAADICDQTIAVYDDATTQSRYFCGGIISAGQEPHQIMKSLLDSCAGVMEWVNGKWYAWAYNADSIVAQTTITESELLDFPNWELNRSSKDAINSIKPVIRSTETAWQPSSVESVEALRKLSGSTSGSTMTVADHGLEDGDRVKFVWWTGSTIDNSSLPAALSAEVYYYVINATANTFQVSATEGGSALTLGTTSGQLTALHDIYLSQDGERNSQEQVFTMVNDPTMARRLSIINLRQIRQEVSGVLVCKPGTAYSCPADLFVGDTIRILNNELSFYEVTASLSGQVLANDTVSASGHGLSNHDSVTLTGVNSSTGLDNGRIYYVRDVATSTFKLAHYRGGPAIDILANDFTVTVQKIQGKLFRVASWRPIINDGIFSIELGVRATATNIYDWTNDREIEPPATPGITVPNLYEVETVANLTADSGTAQLYQQKDGTVITRVKLSWDATDDEYIAASGKVEIQYKLSSDSTWLSYPDIPGAATEAYIVDVIDGEDYDFRVRFRNAFGKAGDTWTTVNDHTVQGKTELPNPPSSFAASYVDGQDRIDLQWTNPADLDLSHTRIGRSASAYQYPWENWPAGANAYDEFSDSGYFMDGFAASKTTASGSDYAFSRLGRVSRFLIGDDIRIQFVYKRVSGTSHPSIYGYNSSDERCTGYGSISYPVTNGELQTQFIDLTVDNGDVAPGSGPCVGFAFESFNTQTHSFEVYYFNARKSEYEIVAEVPVGTTRGQTGDDAIQTWTDFPWIKSTSSKGVYYELRSVDTSGNISSNASPVRASATVAEWEPVQDIDLTAPNADSLKVTWTDTESQGEVILQVFKNGISLAVTRVAESLGEYTYSPVQQGDYYVKAWLAIPFNGLEFVTKPVYSDTVTINLNYVSRSTFEPDTYYVRPTPP